MGKAQTPDCVRWQRLTRKQGTTAPTEKAAPVLSVIWNPILPLTRHLFASAAFRVQKLATTFVPPTGEAIEKRRSLAGEAIEKRR